MSASADAAGKAAQTDPREAYRAMTALNRLLLEAGLCETRRELVFHILNKTVGYTPYDRAYLFGCEPGFYRFLGASGTTTADPQSAPVEERLGMVKQLSQQAAPFYLTQARVPETLRPTLARLQRDYEGTAILCVPITVRGQPVALLWLERWNGVPWPEGAPEQLQALALGYGNAWRLFRAGIHEIRDRYVRTATMIAAGVCAVLLALLVLVRVPLRIVAPCEVIADNPLAVTAPVDGVVREIAVTPGATVGKAELLFVYEEQIPRDELEAARQRVSVVVAQIEQARAEALSNPARRGDVQLLQARLAEEEARLASAEYRVSQLRVTAPAVGVALFHDANDWRGRPVTVGERVMLIVNPRESKLRIWLPQDDRIEIDVSRPVHVLLNTATSDFAEADIGYISKYAEPIPTGGMGFAAEAAWRDQSPAHWMGLKGSAVLYGPPVPLYQWLFRRPLNAARLFLGW